VEHGTFLNFGLKFSGELVELYKVRPEVEIVHNSGNGAKRSMRPGRHCAGAAFGGAKIWNSENWPLLANWRLHCRQVGSLVQQLSRLISANLLNTLQRKVLI